jgi:ABC-type transport system involved in cytochrome c biogenesis permease subunit
MLSAPEAPWVIGGLLCYAAGIAYAVADAFADRPGSRKVLIATVCGAALLSGAITERWLRSAYGPFYTLFEILLSSLFSLGLMSAVLYWVVPLTRIGAIVTLPILFLLGLWTLNVSPAPSPQPATYDSVWLWVHVGVGKLFLGVLLVAVGMAGALLLVRTTGAGNARLPSHDAIDELSWRLVAVAFVFHSLMLIAGAVWAQDAWGRFWAWDPLETWTLITWLAIGAGLHLRVAYGFPRVFGRVYILAVFALAFLTFFGVPFSSIAPHKGIM